MTELAATGSNTQALFLAGLSFVGLGLVIRFVLR